MSDLLPDVPAWQLIVVFGLFFAAMTYLYIDWRRHGAYGYLQKHSLQLELFGIPDREIPRDMPDEIDLIPRGRITAFAKPWFTLTFDTPWKMWRGTVTSVRIKSVLWFNPIDNVSGSGSVPVVVDAGNGEPFRAGLRIEYL